MTYSVTFTNPTKTPITVTTGTINQTTSVSLVGKNVANYGQTFARNFITLLENSAYITAPGSPIEGQLWFDTSLPHDKVLRVYDGAVWRSTSNIYTGTTDPNLPPNLPSKNGDLWVDTAQLKLKMYRNGVWTPVGFDPSNSANKTGSYTENIEGTDGVFHECLITFLANEVISIVSKDKFTPTASINGFVEIMPGLNITKRGFANTTATITGFSDAALKLKISSEPEPISADSFLRNDTAGTINGFLRIQSNAGVRIGFDTQSFFLEKIINDGVITNSVAGAGLRFRTKQTVSSLVYDELLVIDGANLRVGIKKQLPLYDLDVGGTVNIDGQLTVQSSAANSIYTNGSVNAVKDLRAGQTLTVNSSSYLKSKVELGQAGGLGTIIEPKTTATYDIGSAAFPFRNIYVNGIISTSTVKAFVSTGMIIPYAGAVVPDGYLECDGSEVSGISYSQLKFVLGTTYGAPTTATNVKIPDLRTKYLVTDGSAVTIKYVIKT